MDFARAGVFHQLLKVTCPAGRYAARFRIVVNADDLKPKPGLIAKAVGELLAYRLRARNRHATGVVTTITQPARAEANRRTAHHHARAGQKVPGQINTERTFKIGVKGHQTGAEHQAHGPVLQQQQQFGGDFYAAPGAVKIGDPANHLEHNEGGQGHQQMHVEKRQLIDPAHHPQSDEHNGYVGESLHQRD